MPVECGRLHRIGVLASDARSLVDQQAYNGIMTAQRSSP